MFRDINNGWRRINVCKFPSQKNGRNVWNESIMEMCCAMKCEIDRNIISYSTQTARIYYELDGKRRIYTADFLVYRKVGRPLIIEVKYQRQITPWFEQLFRIITPICDHAGFDFAVRTEQHLLKEPMLSTLKRLRGYARIPILPQHQILCREFFSSRATVPLAEVFEFFEARGGDRRVVLALMYHNFILTDYSISLDLNSPVWLPTDTENNYGGGL